MKPRGGGSTIYTYIYFLRIFITDYLFLKKKIISAHISFYIVN